MPSNNELSDQLATLMSRLDTMQLEINTLRSQSTTGTPARVESVKEPTVSKPEPFSGAEGSKLSIFLQQCELSFEAISSNLLWNDDALYSQFYKGLADPIKDELSKNPPATLREFITAAIRIDNRRVERSAPAPEQKSSIRTIEPPRPPSSSPSPSLSKYPKMDAEERARCKDEGRYFRCREISHVKDDCPLKGKSEKEPTPVSFMIGGTPSYPQWTFAHKTGPHESEVGWRSKVTPLVEQA